MAAGGFFDGQTSAEERRRYLLGLLATGGAAKLQDGAGSVGADGGSASGSGDNGAGAIGDAELSALLARDETEREIYCRLDAPAARSATGSAAGAAGAVSAGGAAPLSRLASEEACAPLIAAARLAAAPPRKEDAAAVVGRNGRRQREGAVYGDENADPQAAKGRKRRKVMHLVARDSDSD